MHTTEQAGWDTRLRQLTVTPEEVLGVVHTFIVLQDPLEGDKRASMPHYGFSKEDFVLAHQVCDEANTRMKSLGATLVPDSCSAPVLIPHAYELLHRGMMCEFLRQGSALGRSVRRWQIATCVLLVTTGFLSLVELFEHLRPHQ